MTIEWTSEDGDTKRCRKLVSGLDILLERSLLAIQQLAA
jgi:hypothetical protein